MALQKFIKIAGFALIIIGTLGLLFNEFVWNTSSSRTIIFGAGSLTGLGSLAFAHFGMRDRE
ncbi:hypothetical protein ACFLW6_05005 [Chloroflexota bacterium]